MTRRRTLLLLVLLAACCVGWTTASRTRTLSIGPGFAPMARGGVAASVAPHPGIYSLGWWDVANISNSVGSPMVIPSLGSSSWSLTQATEANKPLVENYNGFPCLRTGNYKYVSTTSSGKYFSTGLVSTTVLFVFRAGIGGSGGAPFGSIRWLWTGGGVHAFGQYGVSSWGQIWGSGNSIPAITGKYPHQVISSGSITLLRLDLGPDQNSYSIFINKQSVASGTHVSLKTPIASYSTALGEFWMGCDQYNYPTYYVQMFEAAVIPTEYAGVGEAYLISKYGIL